MKKILILIVFFIIACNSNPVPKPDHLLSEDQMKDILYDLAILQAMESYNPGKLRENGVDARSYIFDKYQIDSTVFYQNQRYYASNARKYKKMYKAILERVNNQISEEDSINQENNLGAKKKDSIIKSKRSRINRDSISNNLPLK